MIGFDVEKITGEVDKLQEVRKKHLKIISSCIITILIILCIINYFTKEYSLYNTFVFMIPLVAFLYYDVFLNSELNYNRFDKYLLIIFIPLYLLLLLILEIYQIKVIIGLLNVSTCVIYFLIIKSLITHMYLKLLLYSLKDVKDNIERYSLIVTQDDSKKETNLKKYFNDIYNDFVKIEYWFQVTPTSIVLKNIFRVLKILELITKFTLDIKNISYLNADDPIENISKIVKHYEFVCYIKAMNETKSTHLQLILFYCIDKINYLYNRNFLGAYEKECEKYLMSELEGIIQEGKTIDFDKGMALFTDSIEEKLKKNPTTEQLTYLRKCIFLSVIILRKYLDNINSVSGKLILQLISNNYSAISVSDNDLELNSNLFILIDLLKSKDSNNSTLKIYYHYLSKVVDQFPIIDNKIKFLRAIIINLSTHEEEISYLVFDDVKNLHNIKNCCIEDVMIAMLKVHNTFKTDVSNPNTKALIDFIVKEKNIIKEKTILDSLSYLIVNKPQYGKYFFRLLYEMIDSSELTIYDFIVESKHRLFKLEDKILFYRSVNDDFMDLVKHIFRFNQKVLSIRPSVDNDKDMLRFFEHTLDVLEDYYKTSTNDKQMVHAIEWIHYIIKDNLYTNNYKYGVKVLSKIGLRSFHLENSIVQTTISNNLGWTIFEGIKSSNIKIESIHTSFCQLLEYFTKACQFSTLFVARYIGTAIVVNYIQLRLYYTQQKDYKIYDNYIKIKISETSKYKEIFIDAINMQEGILEDFFSQQTALANQYINILKNMIK